MRQIDKEASRQTKETDRQTKETDRHTDRHTWKGVVCLLLHAIAEQFEVGRKGGIRMGVVEVDDVGTVSAQQILVSDLTYQK